MKVRLVVVEKNCFIVFTSGFKNQTCSASKNYSYSRKELLEIIENLNYYPDFSTNKYCWYSTEKYFVIKERFN